MKLALLGLVLLAAGAARGPCFGLGSRGTLNSDGSGSHPKDNVPFSTSQNVGFDVTAGALRWQSTHWYFPGPPYRTVKRDVFVSLVSAQVFFWDEASGACRASRMAGAVPGAAELACVAGWAPWAGACGSPPCDTFAIGERNVTTWAPAAERTSFLPARSLLAESDTGLSWQLRVRENGHYRLLLSLENVGWDATFGLAPPPACANATAGPVWQEDTLIPPFWSGDYW